MVTCHFLTFNAVSLCQSQKWHLGPPQVNSWLSFLIVKHKNIQMLLLEIALQVNVHLYGIDSFMVKLRVVATGYNRGSMVWVMVKPIDNVWTWLIPQMAHFETSTTPHLDDQFILEAAT